ncbi:UDP-N-acetylmuramoyl-tripeptide--D-alanyl-D-alanine ligase [Caenispirillum salinarum]|uniref:UDP-N-acetylmuramoyl-tripeptide--D-alanyl-D- alanine ligase n=1 Tax=Caenispirillum salinarum TaxID=859058 RepID=UPI00384EE656
MTDATNTPLPPSARPALWTAAEAAAATGGKASGDWTCTGVSIDSRTVGAGDLFIAIAGPTHDGHAFVADALAKGAVAAMVHAVPEDFGQPERLLVVDDTFAGLQALGRAARERLTGKVIAVTGSVGKTGTKEMLALACTRLGGGPVHATQGNLNNHWGLPLTLARCPRDAAWCILEMGMNHAEEIRPLSRLARPHVAVITAVEAVHLEHFDSVEGIARAKAEILDGVVDGGTAVLPRDNPHHALLLATAERLDLRTTSFGAHIHASARLLHTNTTDAGLRVLADFYGANLEYTVGATGRHWAINSLAVLAAVRAAGGDAAEAALALGAMTPPKGRGKRQSISLPESRGGGLLTIIDESYNASPVSMRAALTVLNGMTPGRGGRRVAVLGDMLELGGESDALHAGLADAVSGSRIDRVHTCGTHMAHLASALPEDRRGRHADDSTALAPLVAADVRGGDVVMVKGSLGSRMAVVLEALLALDADGKGGGTDHDDTGNG